MKPTLAIFIFLIALLSGNDASAKSCDASFAQPYLVTSESGLKIRKGPSTDFEKIGAIPFQHETLVCSCSDFELPTVIVGGQEGRWVKVYHGDLEGYVFDAYLKPSPIFIIPVEMLYSDMEMLKQKMRWFAYGAPNDDQVHPQGQATECKLVFEEDYFGEYDGLKTHIWNPLVPENHQLLISGLSEAAAHAQIGFFFNYQSIYPGKMELWNAANGTTNALYALGTVEEGVIEGHYSKQFSVSNYSLKVDFKHDDLFESKTLIENINFEVNNYFDYTLPQLFWIGDVNQDGKVEVILSIDDGHHCWRYEIFNSKPQENQKAYQSSVLERCGC